MKQNLASLFFLVIFSVSMMVVSAASFHSTSHSYNSTLARHHHEHRKSRNSHTTHKKVFNRSRKRLTTKNGSTKTSSTTTSSFTIYTYTSTIAIKPIVPSPLTTSIAVKSSSTKASAAKSSSTKTSTVKSSSTKTSTSAVATTTTKKTATATSSPVPAPTSSAGSGISTGAGTTYTGDGTWFNTGLGSCGWTNSDTEFIAALDAPLMNNPANPNNNPLCGRMIKVTNQANNKSVTVKIVDTCPPCLSGSVDMSVAAFSQIADLDTGRIKISWQYAS